jgi:hypothetical protein
MVSVADAVARWAEFDEPQQRHAETKMVGLAGLGPPYSSAAFRNRNYIVPGRDCERSVAVFSALG